MRPIFTPHAGEFLVGEEIEQGIGRDLKLNVWLPSKDVGVDLLVTNSGNSRSCALQVKFSRDYSDLNKMPVLAGDEVVSSGWFKFARKKIETSPADYWVLIIVSAKRAGEKLRKQHILIKPKDLLGRLLKTYGKLDNFQLFIAVTATGSAFDWRGIKSSSQPGEISELRKSHRDYTKCLEDWTCLERIA